MTMQEANEQKIIFPDNISEMILGILKQYGIEETNQEVEEKLFGENNDPPKEAIILNLAIEIIEKRIRKEDLPALLQQQLKIPPQTAGNMAKMIEEKIIIPSKKVSREEWERGRLKDTIYKDEEELEQEKIVFDFPEDATLDKVVGEILKRNNLAESSSGVLKKSQEGVELRSSILQDAILIVIKKTIPESKLIEFLEKHLEISNKTARKIIEDIHQTIIPFAKITNPKEDGEVSIIETEELKKEAFRKAKEELLRKIGANKIASPPAPNNESTIHYKKNPDITDVEDNAHKIEQERKPVVSENTNPESPQPKTESKSDPYKEQIQ